MTDLVRQEYSYIPEETFRAKRAQILKKIWQRPWIYATLHGRDRWDRQAHENLARSLDKLTDGKWRND